MFKNHIKIFFLCSFIIITIVYLYRYFGQKIVYDKERVTWETKANMIANLSDYNFNYLLFGDSRALAINPIYLEEKFGLKIINLSTGGSTLPAIYYFIKRVVENKNNLSNLDKIFISVSPQNISTQETSINRSLGERFIRFVASEEEVNEISEYYPKVRIKYDSIYEFPYKGYFYKRDHTIALGLIDSYIKNISNQGLRKKLIEVKGFSISNPYHYDFEKINSIVSEKKLNKYMKKLKFGNNKIDKISYIYMKKIITLLQSENIEFEFFLAPMPDMRKKFDDLLFGESIHVYNILNRENINPKVLLLPRKYFKDPSHVNYQGSALFNKYFYICVLKNECNDNNIYHMKGINND